jgi:hypothetical protein
MRRCANSINKNSKIDERPEMQRALISFMSNSMLDVGITHVSVQYQCHEEIIQSKVPSAGLQKFPSKAKCFSQFFKYSPLLEVLKVKHIGMYVSSEMVLQFQLLFSFAQVEGPPIFNWIALVLINSQEG